jgi:hypothetical protein
MGMMSWKETEPHHRVTNGELSKDICDGSAAYCECQVMSTRTGISFLMGIAALRISLQGLVRGRGRRRDKRIEFSL